MVFEKLARILSESVGVDEEDITLETELTSDYGIEPIDIAKIIIECEKEFHITIHDEDVHTFKKLKDVVAYVDKIISEI